MENERLTFEQVCERYEFADWELAELVEQGEIVPDQEQKFTPDEILRFLRANPRHFFSFRVASQLFGKSETTIRNQALAGKVQAKKIASSWAINAKSMDKYIKSHARKSYTRKV